MARLNRVPGCKTKQRSGWDGCSSVFFEFSYLLSFGERAQSSVSLFRLVSLVGGKRRPVIFFAFYTGHVTRCRRLWGKWKMWRHKVPGAWWDTRPYGISLQGNQPLTSTLFNIPLGDGLSDKCNLASKTVDIIAYPGGWVEWKIVHTIGHPWGDGLSDKCNVASKTVDIIAYPGGWVEWQMQSV